MKMSKILVALTFMFALLGAPIGTFATGIHVLDIAPSGSQPVPDSIVVTDTATSSVVCQGVNTASKSCFLPDGAYQITVAKAGYDAKAIPLVRLSSSDWTSYYVLTSTAPPPPADGGTTPADGTTTPPAGQTIVLKSLDLSADTAKPTSAVDVAISVKNSWGYDAFDLVATVSIIGIDNSEDLEQEVNFGRLNNKDTEDATATFTVPIDAKEKKYDVKVKFEWQDEDSHQFTQAGQRSEVLEVERASHEVALTSAQFTSDLVRSGEQSQVAVTLSNIGKKDESVRVKVQSDDLGVQEFSPVFKLGQSEETTQYIPFAVSKDARPGRHVVFFTVTFNDGKDTATGSEVINVGAARSEDAQALPAVTVTPVAVSTAPGNAETQSGTPQIDNNVLFAVFGGLVVVIAAIVMVLRTTQTAPASKRRGQ
ncbi:MAG: hypothetical protein HY438_02480 [DPANN group archaeon]|nr:hypothetical protein [DPANN group archaeon]